MHAGCYKHTAGEGRDIHVFSAEPPPHVRGMEHPVKGHETGHDSRVVDCAAVVGVAVQIVTIFRVGKRGRRKEGGCAHVMMTRPSLRARSMACGGAGGECHSFSRGKSVTVCHGSTRRFCTHLHEAVAAVAGKLCEQTGFEPEYAEEARGCERDRLAEPVEGAVDVAAAKCYSLWNV